MIGETGLTPQIIADCLLEGDITEDLESKMPQLMVMIAKRGNDRFSNPYADLTPDQQEAAIRNVAEIDPTPNQKLIVQLVNQLRFGFLDEEDFPRLYDTLVRFFKIIKSPREKRKWLEAGEKNQVDAYLSKGKNWINLEGKIREFISGREWEFPTDKDNSEEKWMAGAKVFHEFEIKAQEERGNEIIIVNKHMQLLTITTPYAAVVYGTRPEETTWCTTHLSPTGNSFVKEPMRWFFSDNNQYYHSYEDRNNSEIVEGGIWATGYPTTAAKYMEEGPLRIIREDGKSLVQATGNFDQFMVDNQRGRLEQCSPLLDLTLSGFYKDKTIDSAAIDNINSFRKTCTRSTYRWPSEYDEDGNVVKYSERPPIISRSRRNW